MKIYHMQTALTVISDLFFILFRFIFISFLDVYPIVSVPREAPKLKF